MNDKTKTGAEGFSLQEWAASNPKAFDRFEAYKQHIEPLVMALRDACQEHRMALAYVVGHTQNQDGTNAVAAGAHFPSASEAFAEVIAANFTAKGEVHRAIAVHQADMARMMRLQAFFPASGSVH